VRNAGLAVLVIAPITKCSAWNIQRDLFDGTNPTMELNVWRNVADYTSFRWG
jgi:hypothetical protein